MLIMSTGCSFPRVNTGVMQTGPGTYMIATSGHFTTDLATLKKVTYRDANAFAEKNNKVIVPISSKDVDRTMSQNPSFELQFQLADKGDASVKGMHLKPNPDLTVKVISANQ